MSTDQERARLLLVDDDPMVSGMLVRVLTRDGYAVEAVSRGEDALARLARGGIDLVISDISMPGLSGIELLRRIRLADDQVPVIFVTGAPRVEDAMRALEYGAFRFLTKPVAREVLVEAIEEGLKWQRLSRASAEGPAAMQRADLEERFERALASMRMVYQPIAAVRSKQAFGYEALMRSSEATLPSPPAVLDAAEKLGSLHALGRHLRALVAAQADVAKYEHVFFVNLHSADLADPELFDPGAPLSRHARSVVLELTERASLETIPEVERRFSRLRELGYRIAVDDLGAGYAGLSYFARVRPDLVKVDMSLVRGIDTNGVKRRVVASICELSRALDMLVVCEGIETAEELECVTSIGAHLVQGYAVARPGAPYPAVTL